jgi:F0F1-type ATP synthase beta subunit
MKEGKDSTTAAADFKYSMSGKVISITYLGTGSIHEEIGRILRRIEHWHQGSIKSFRILYQDADGLGDEVNWDGEKAEVVAPRR